MQPKQKNVRKGSMTAEAHKHSFFFKKQKLIQIQIATRLSLERYPIWIPNGFLPSPSSWHIPRKYRWRTIPTTSSSAGSRKVTRTPVASQGKVSARIRKVTRKNIFYYFEKNRIPVFSYYCAPSVLSKIKHIPVTKYLFFRDGTFI